MIDSKVLLEKCQKLQKRLEADLLERSQSADVPAVGEKLRAEYQDAFSNKRTGHAYEAWRQEMITQHAAAWVVTCVFVRFLEDNGFLHARLSGPRGENPGDANDRWLAARDHYDQFFVAHRDQSDRDYLLNLFDELVREPGLEGLFGKHNPLRDHPTWLSNDAANEIIQFFRRLDSQSGHLELDFTSPKSSARHPESAAGQREETRFLGDLYQDLSEDARKRFALLQTPDFVEQFILDRTLEPAWEEWIATGKPGGVFRMIDPACGSGHFLLGSFHRILNHWQRIEPGTPVKALVVRTLDSIHGVDVNPFAIAISRFRLLIAALRACGVTRIADAPNFGFHLACGDSLLHGSNNLFQLDFVEVAHFYQPEDLEELRRILVPGHFQAVVANPPYITVKDKALNEAIRAKYQSCHRQYSLSVPFMERIFQLATKGGYTGQITADSFMKREFGSKLIEEFFPRVDLTHVIHTSGAYIPGHGTPTVILFGRNRLPQSPVVRAVLGIQGEPSTPEDPSKGLVWSAILDQVNQPGSQSKYISAIDMDREIFHSHPWSIGGGGAAELKAKIDHTQKTCLNELILEIGFGAVTREDDAYIISSQSAKRKNIDDKKIIQLVEGVDARDWIINSPEGSIWPYNNNTLNAESNQEIKTLLWPCRRILSERVAFGLSQVQRGLEWFEYSMFFKDRFRIPLSIAFAEIASHNHFVLDRGGKVFKGTAPVIKLPANATEEDHLVLLGLLNSSTACFWMKQVSHQKQMMGGDGVRVSSKAQVPYQFAGTQLLNFPIPELFQHGNLRDRLLKLTIQMDRIALYHASLSATNAISEGLPGGASKIRSVFSDFQEKRKNAHAQMIFLQEEIDFTAYAMFGIANESLLCEKWDCKNGFINTGMRPFEILHQKNVDGFSVPKEIPTDWPDDIQSVWYKRKEAIATSSDLSIIEDSHYKRRWIGRQGVFNHSARQDEFSSACLDWMLLRLERYLDLDGRMALSPDLPSILHFSDPELVSFARLAQVAGQDPDFLQVGALYRGDQAFDVFGLVSELVEKESVPLLPICRYKPEGLIKRTVWERTWDLQRAEDRGESVGTIPVPPKYASSDFQKPDYWRLRGKLDMPKERWVGFPHIRASDGSPMIAWAGYDHLQLAQAISSYFVQVQEREGGTEDSRLRPLLACLIELLPWLKQWHNEIHPEFGQGMGDYFAGFANEEARRLGLTLEEARAWQPDPRSATRRAPAKRKTAIAPKDLFGDEIGEAPDQAKDTPAKTRGRRPKADSAERETQKSKVIELAQTIGQLTNRTCLEGLGLEATPGNTTLVSSLLKELSGEEGPLTKVGTKGPGVYYTLKG